MGTENAIRVGDVEAAVQHEHAERLIQTVEKHGTVLRDAIAVCIAKECNAIGARPDVARLAEKILFTFVLFVFRRLWFSAGFRDQDIPAGQHIQPSRADQVLGKTLNAKTRRRCRGGAWGPMAGRGIILSFCRLRVRAVLAVGRDPGGLVVLFVQRELSRAQWRR